ncbi:MAG: fatty acid desaturase [Gammaproteobacteria bacterium]|nr:fatty acid desaturase [Gammaproteobacteria bacterium]
MTIDLQFNTKANGYVSALTITAIWAVIFLSVYLSFIYSHHTYLLSVFIIGTCQRYLAELSHQAMHRNLFSHQTLNDRLDFFYAIPLFYTVQGTRAEHYSHHLNLEAEQAKINYSYDHLGISGKLLKYRWYRLVVLYIQPFIGVQSFIEFKNILINTKEYFFNCYIFHILLLTVLFYFHLESIYLYYWLIPFFTVYCIFYYYAELFSHFGCRDLHLSRDTVHWFVNLFVAPFGFCQYHSLHHISPKTPWFKYQGFGENYVKNRQSLSQTFKNMFLLKSV